MSHHQTFLTADGHCPIFSRSRSSESNSGDLHDRRAAVERAAVERGAGANAREDLRLHAGIVATLALAAITSGGGAFLRLYRLSRKWHDARTGTR